MSTPDLLAVHGQVLERLGELAEQWDQHAPAYARAYAAYIAGEGRRSPIPPPGLTSQQAKDVREQVLEEHAASVAFPSFRATGRSAA